MAVIDSGVESVKHAGTPGGNRLRALRDYMGRTQLDIELDASLGIGYLQRLESGKVKYPEHDTLERILAALHAPYMERRDILELFGYVVDTPLPTEAETRWAVDACRDELQMAVFPAYLLNCAHEMLVWNAFIPRMFTAQVGTSVLRMLFDPAYELNRTIANPDEFFPAQIRALRYEMRLMGGEAWHKARIDDLLLTAPLFAKYWTASGQNPALAARPLIPLELRLPEIGLLRFRLTAEAFAQDRRFRLIYYIPADPPTMQQCIVWLPLRP